MVAEVLRWLRPRPGGRYVDATLGGGGHAEAVLTASEPDGRLLGIDADPEAIERASARLARFGGRVVTVHARFSSLRQVAAAHGFVPSDGVLMDLGVSSDQLETPRRGFSFQLSGPLDMRMDPRSAPTAAEIVNLWPEGRLAELFRRWGEEPRAARIARRIVARRAIRPIETTDELARIVAEAVGRGAGARHPATRVFQALRIAVNRELEELERGLAAALDIVGEGGRVVVIAFHSLEDRCVKQTFRAHEPRCEGRPEGGVRWTFEPPPVKVITRHALRPAAEEVAANPRARSARLRVAERTAAPC
ncbi:MAG: 16S rRNA (cytosine(1402)-N(4))-methyltransferase RsmH [Kiritimatiellae bacterium]|nr:16S rRNA (cytosine(1402)-N(4))-methyltransferase RsmH [Kiritimatiellia bacterium]